MSDNGLEMKVTFDQFKAEKDMNKKLDMLFLVQLSHRSHCADTVKDIEKRLELPTRNRKLDLGVGAGTGTIAGALLTKAAEFIKSYISGG